MTNHETPKATNGLDCDHLPVYLDTETTGLFPQDGAELLEIAIVREDGKVLLDTFVHPMIATSWPEAMAVNHITPDMVKDAPTFEEVAALIKKAVRGRDVLIWNAPFDVAFLPGLLNESNVICAMREYGEYIEKTQPWNASRTGRYKLEYTANDLGVEIEGNAHRALTDVMTTIHVRKAWKSRAFDNSNLGSSKNVEPYQQESSKNGV